MAVLEAAELTGKGFVWFWNNVIVAKLTRSKRERQELLDKINAIHSEVTFNGGGSIKDAIWELKKNVSVIDTKLNGIQENQHVAMNLQGIAFWISSANGECEYVSTNLCKLVGRSESEMLGNGWLAWVIPQDRERIHEAWAFSVENKSAFDEFYTFKKADGTLQKVWGLAFHKKINGVHHGTMGKIEAIN